MVKGFEELGERSDIDDVLSFAAIYKTIEGKTSDFGYIIAQTRDIIKDKVEIAMEIQTEINSAKSEAYMMLVLPLVLHDVHNGKRLYGLIIYNSYRTYCGDCWRDLYICIVCDRYESSRN